jgi:hypothetical protein
MTTRCLTELDSFRIDAKWVISARQPSTRLNTDVMPDGP